MSENSSSNMKEVNETWTKVGEAVNQAGELYLAELGAYLTWAHDFQHEILEQTVITNERLSRIGENQLAFLARIRETTPLFGAVPKGTETVVGMVEAVVNATQRAE